MLKKLISHLNVEFHTLDGVQCRGLDCLRRWWRGGSLKPRLDACLRRRIRIRGVSRRALQGSATADNTELNCDGIECARERTLGLRVRTGAEHAPRKRRPAGGRLCEWGSEKTFASGVVANSFGGRRELSSLAVRVDQSSVITAATCDVRLAPAAQWWSQPRLFFFFEKNIVFEPIYLALLFTPQSTHTSSSLIRDERTSCVCRIRITRLFMPTNVHFIPLF
jgi:hypothetical protein